MQEAGLILDAELQTLVAGLFGVPAIFIAVVFVVVVIGEIIKWFTRS